jgi:hypothetical protein
MHLPHAWRVFLCPSSDTCHFVSRHVRYSFTILSQVWVTRQLFHGYGPIVGWYVFVYDVVCEEKCRSGVRTEHGYKNSTSPVVVRRKAATKESKEKG